MNEKLIKSFMLMEDMKPSAKGDIITMRRYQAMVPLREEELYFENESNGHTFTKKWLMDNLWIKVKPHSVFKSMEEKFDHIS